MGLTSAGTLLLAALLTIAIVVVTLYYWNRLRGPRAARTVSRVAMILMCQVLAIVFTGLAINAGAGFFASWSELFGAPAITAAAPPRVVGQADHSLRTVIRASFLASHGTVVPLVIPAPVAGIPPQRALVYLPAAYGDPNAPNTRFPVVQLMVGFPGHPYNWTGGLQLQRVLDTEIAARRTVPLIAVMPNQNIALPRDTQCVNVVNGPKVDTYLSSDVHRAVIKAFRAIPAASGWAVMGYSTGGFCALNLAMRHPDLFSAAVSLSGYGRTARDHQTGDLFGGSKVLADLNSPIWRIEHLGRPAIKVLFMSSKIDKVPVRDAAAFTTHARPPTYAKDIVFPRGGHNFHLWLAEEPYAFAWMSQWLRTPLAPTLPPVVH
ncbi:MAG: alpha/beta hydrolase-fold protein [Mycobacteriales bacterium]